jgi:hypothetical protein
MATRMRRMGCYHLMQKTNVDAMCQNRSRHLDPFPRRSRSPSWQPSSGRGPAHRGASSRGWPRVTLHQEGSRLPARPPARQRAAAADPSPRGPTPPEHGGQRGFQGNAAGHLMLVMYNCHKIYVDIYPFNIFIRSTSIHYYTGWPLTEGARERGTRPGGIAIDP